MPMTNTLDEQIRRVVTELMESAPPAPSMSELDWRDDRRATTSNRPNSRAGVRPGLLALVGGLGTVAAAILLLVLLLPSVGQKTPVAAAAQLRLIADSAADQPVPRLTSQQWLETTQKVSYVDQLTAIDSKPVTGATASIPGTVTQWSNDFGESCWTSTVGTASFATPANKAAWDGIGLPDTPTYPTTGSCGSVAGANVANGQQGGVVNVAALSTDPATLARQLRTGTTGIYAIDVGLGPPSDPSNGLARAALLLLGPTTGSSANLTAGVYRALALMPNITQLGEVTTHSGTSGLGFSSTSPPFGKRAIVVDPSSGRLLELRNLTGMTPYEAMSMGISRAYARPASSSSGSGNIDWLDPVGAPKVVDSIPSDLAGRLPPISAEVTATETPGTYHSTNDLENQLNSEFNHNLSGGPNLLNGSLVLYLNFNGPVSQVPAFVAAVKDSGLFRSVVVTNGPNSQ